MLSGCGHVLTVDFCRERVAALVREWLTGVGDRKRKGDSIALSPFANRACAAMSRGQVTLLMASAVKS